MAWQWIGEIMEDLLGKIVAVVLFMMWIFNAVSYVKVLLEIRKEMGTRQKQKWVKFKVLDMDSWVKLEFSLCGAWEGVSSNSGMTKVSVCTKSVAVCGYEVVALGS